MVAGGERKWTYRWKSAEIHVPGCEERSGDTRQGRWEWMARQTHNTGSAWVGLTSSTVYCAHVLECLVGPDDLGPATWHVAKTASLVVRAYQSVQNADDRKLPAFSWLKRPSCFRGSLSQSANILTRYNYPRRLITSRSLWLKRGDNSKIMFARVRSTRPGKVDVIQKFDHRVFVAAYPPPFSPAPISLLS